MMEYAQFAVVKVLDESVYNKVAAYGFVTEEGAEEERQWCEENGPEGNTYEVVEHQQGADVMLYYDGEQFSRTPSTAERIAPE